MVNSSNLIISCSFRKSTPKPRLSRILKSHIIKEMPKIELKPGSAEYAETKKTVKTQACDMPGCNACAEHKAPKHRGLNEYYHFCIEHAQEYNKAWRRLGQRLNIPGFRRGTAPRAMVEKTVGVDRIKQEFFVAKLLIRPFVMFF